MSKIFAEVLLRKITVFYYTQSIQLFWHEWTEETAPYISLINFFLSPYNLLKVLVELFFEVPQCGCSRSPLANKNMFKVDDNKEL